MIDGGRLALSYTSRIPQFGLGEANRANTNLYGKGNSNVPVPSPAPTGTAWFASYSMVRLVNKCNVTSHGIPSPRE